MTPKRRIRYLVSDLIHYVNTAMTFEHERRPLLHFLHIEDRIKNGIHETKYERSRQERIYRVLWWSVLGGNNMQLEKRALHPLWLSTRRGQDRRSEDSLMSAHWVFNEATLLSRVT